jgi:hypothetical protein
MSRLKYFFRNAGTSNILKLFILSVLVLFALKKDIAVGLWLYSFPAFIAGLAIAFFAREFILQQFSVAKIIMNVAAIAGIVFAAIMQRSSGSEPDWLRVSLAFIIAFYVSAYFWTLSDWRIGRA